MHGQQPWLFFRDEVDVLEEEFDRLFDPQEQHHGGGHAMEEDVLREHLDAEEATEVDLVLKLGPRARSRGAEMPHAHDHPADEGVSLKDMLKRHADRDPVYRQAYTWALAVSRLAREAYLARPDSKDAFRLRVNAPLVPVKISVAQSEEQAEDRAGIEIAASQLSLAILYLERATQALQELSKQGHLPSESRWMLFDAADLTSRLSQARKRLSSNKPTFPGNE